MDVWTGGNCVVLVDQVILKVRNLQEVSSSGADKHGAAARRGAAGK